MLKSGTRLGPYEVVALLGAGGMGEVFRARDTRLNRDVALKILPDLFASDAERIARFTREAQTLAALNHPHIAQIYGIEEHVAGGAESADLRALVMELVDGETLAERITRGAVPLDEAVPFARHIAEALEAAHEQGIVHRDLKPANIKVRPDGAVKVLDFGLAKALEPRSPSASLVSSPTITSPAMTQAGLILGTAAYMSPEQAKGRPADKRSDIWAFGCVFYEMVTGRRPFDGDDVSETLASILKSDPDWSALPGDTPAAIRLLLRRCLERDPRRRVGDMSAVRFVLDDGLALTSAGESTPRRRLAPLAATLAAIVALTAVGVWTFWPQPPDRPITRFSLSLPEGQQLALIARPQVAISRDGGQLVYHTTQQLLYRQFADVQWRELVAGAAAQGANTPDFSPDGQSIAYYANSESVIKRVAVTGGASTTLCRTPAPLTLSWDTSGILFSAIGRVEAGSSRTAVFRCPASGGEPEQIATVAAGEEVYGPRMLPGGKSLLFTVAKTSDGPARWDKAQIIVQSIAGGSRKTVVTGGSDARYVKSGHLLYAVSGVVFAAPFDIDREVLTGPAVPVLEGVRRSATANNGVAQFATSDTGTLVYVPGPVLTGSSERTLAIADRSGNVTRLPVDPAHYTQTRASPDGARLIVATDDGRQAIVWMYRLDGKSAMQRVTQGGNNRFPIWSPDGVRIAFQSDREGDAGIFAQRVDGVGGAERLTKAGQGELHVPESWSPDGKYILYALEKDGVYSLRVLALSEKTSTLYGDVQSTEPPNAVFSPDGRWVAYTIGERGGVASPNRGVFLQPFPATGAIYQVPQQRLDFQPVWSRDGNELFFVPSAASGQMAVFTVTRKEGATFSSPTTFPARVTADRVSGERRAYDILPDGRFVGLLTAGEIGRFTGIEVRVVLNWFEELRQRAPNP